MTTWSLCKVGVSAQPSLGAGYHGGTEEEERLTWGHPQHTSGHHGQELLDGADNDWCNGRVKAGARLYEDIHHVGGDHIYPRPLGYHHQSSYSQEGEDKHSATQGLKNTSPSFIFHSFLVHYFREFLFYIIMTSSKPDQCLPGIFLSPLLHQPVWGVRDEEDRDAQETGWHCLKPGNHPP